MKLEPCSPRKTHMNIKSYPILQGRGGIQGRVMNLGLRLRAPTQMSRGSRWVEEVNEDCWVRLPHEGAGLSRSSSISLYLGLVLQGCPIWKLEIRFSLSFF